VQEGEAGSDADFSEPVVIAVTQPVQIIAEKPKVTPRTTIKVADLLRVEPKKDNVESATPLKKANTSSFTPEQMQMYWTEFSQQRRKFQAEFQLLSQPYEVEGTLIKLSLLSPVQETMLNAIKPDLIAFLREKLVNDTILVTGVLGETDDKKIMYTSRDKFEYLQKKIPVLKEFKDRLGLDTDF
jgi:hypothetical protein